jgi:hypothetical protein
MKDKNTRFLIITSEGLWGMGKRKSQAWQGATLTAKKIQSGVKATFYEILLDDSSKLSAEDIKKGYVAHIALDPEYKEGDYLEPTVDSDGYVFYKGQLVERKRLEA